MYNCFKLAYQHAIEAAAYSESIIHKHTTKVKAIYNSWVLSLKKKVTKARAYIYICFMFGL